MGAEEQEKNPFGERNTQREEDPFANDNDDEKQTEEKPPTPPVYQVELKPNQQLVEMVRAIVKSTDNGDAANKKVPPVTKVELTPSQQLVEMIQGTVEPSSWEVNGGKARVYEINGRLVVRQHPKVIREIEELLDEVTNH